MFILKLEKWSVHIIQIVKYKEMYIFKNTFNVI